MGKGSGLFEESQSENTLIRISEEDGHSPEFVLTHNSEILVMALMEIFLLDSIIRMVRRHTSHIREDKGRYIQVCE